MNQVRLAGKLCTHVEVGATERGALVAKARLKFNEKDDSIGIFCVSEQADELSKLEIGAEIFIRGEGKSVRAAIAVDRIEPVSLQTPDARRDIELYSAVRMHSLNATGAKLRTKPRH